jgi:hypothetical protein
LTCGFLSPSTFVEVGFNLPVVAPVNAARLAAATPLKPTERGLLIGATFAEAHGVDLGLDDKTRRKYRRLAREHGIAFSSGTGAPSVRLDWPSGHQIVIPSP